jgi:thymidylate synthase
MNNLDKQYTALLQDILDNGVTKQDRTGTGTLSIFGRQIRHKMSEGFPLLTTKKMPFRIIATELTWFLRGDTNIKYLVDNNCHIWDGDAYQAYLKNWKPQPVVENELHWLEQELVSDRPLPKDMFIHCIKTDADFAKKWGELGPIYGKQWRSWEQNSVAPWGVDQIANSLNLLKTDPDSRRNKVSAWNVGELDQMTLPPCHTDFQFYTRELSLGERTEYKKKRDGIARTFAPYTHQMLDGSNIPTRAISLMWNQRSVDTFLGLPFNIASYGLLLEIIAKAVNMVPDELIGNLGDTHLYLNHIDQATEQIGRELTDEERYHIWFGNNYETGMERFFDPNNLPNFNDVYYEPTPTRTREPYPLPTLNINTEWWPTESGECGVGPIDAVAVVEGFSNDNFCKCLIEEDIQLSNYQSHPSIKALLSN